MNDTNDRPVNNPMPDKRNPYAVWFVVIAFVAPVVLAYVMFFLVEVNSFTNRGEILNPINHISSLKLTDDAGNLIPESKLTYKWRLISFLPKSCDEACASRIYDTRQIHSSLSKNRHRVYRMFIHLEPMDEDLVKLIAEEHPNVIHVYGKENEIIKALGANIREDAGIKNNETYIMDPMGNVMMRFTVDQPNKDFLFDLKKLLKASQIG